MAFLETDEGEIWFEALGEGRPLLLLRGLGRSSRYWLGFERILAKDFRVILMDQRGLGRTNVPARWSDDIGTLARDALLIMEHLEIPKFHVFGLSLGGMVALKMASYAPERIISLIVANSSSRDGKAWRLNPRVLPLLLIAACRSRFHETLLEQLLGLPVGDDKREEILKNWQEIRAKEGFPLLTIAKQISIARRFSIKNLFPSGNISPPLLLLAGDLDHFVSPENSQALHAHLVGSILQTLQGAGHEIAVLHQRELADIIANFFTSQAKDTL